MGPCDESFPSFWLHCNDDDPDSLAVTPLWIPQTISTTCKGGPVVLISNTTTFTVFDDSQMYLITHDVWLAISLSNRLRRTSGQHYPVHYIWSIRDVGPLILKSDECIKDYPGLADLKMACEQAVLNQLGYLSTKCPLELGSDEFSYHLWTFQQRAPGWCKEYFHLLVLHHEMGNDEGGVAVKITIDGRLARGFITTDLSAFRLSWSSRGQQRDRVVPAMEFEFLHGIVINSMSGLMFEQEHVNNN